MFSNYVSLVNHIVKSVYSIYKAFEHLVKVLAQVRQEYSEKIGVEELNHLDTALRRVVSKIDLAYMPESWANSN